MPNPLALKLHSFADLHDDDLRAIDGLCTDVRSHRARESLIKEGDRPSHVFLLLEGWACRYKLLPDGRRAIVAYLVPGDLCDPHVFILKEMDHSIGLLTDARVAAIPKEKMLAVFDGRPALARALWWSSLVDESVLREWLVNIGQRDARVRLAHLLVELWHRLRNVGQTTGGSLELPLTQEVLGDTVGLTSVHVNRTLQGLRSEGLIELRAGRLHIPDMARLIAMSGFDPNYLHLDRRGDRPERGPSSGGSVFLS